MDEKNLVERDKAAKAHVYRPMQAQTETQKNLVADLLEKAFRGSALRLVRHVLKAKPASAGELKEIRKLTNEAERKTNEPGNFHLLETCRKYRLDARAFGPADCFNRALFIFCSVNAAAIFGKCALRCSSLSARFRGNFANRYVRANDGKCSN
jgi:hypothetical protein